MTKRIGLLTSGGDCQALNATMRGVVKGLSNAIDDLEVYGFDDGYKGLIYGKYRMLTSKDFSGILTQGGTILGTSRQPFKMMRVPDEKGLDKVEAMIQLLEKNSSYWYIEDGQLYFETDALVSQYNGLYDDLNQYVKDNFSSSNNESNTNSSI